MRKTARSSRSKPAKYVKPSRVGRAQFSSWQTPEAVRQLKILAAEESTTVQALTAEALNMLFEKYGKSPVAKG